MKRPVEEKHKISQYFGNKLIINGEDVYIKWGLVGHNGIDFSTPVNTPVYAPHDGKITERAYDANGYGFYYKLQNSKEASVLAHLSSFVANLNQEVKEGDLVCYTGQSGYCTGPHLHWGYYREPRNRSNGYDGYIDLLPYLTLSPSHNSSPNTGSDAIKDFLISKGYTYPETHLEVIKVMYDSDLKIKSGQFISKEDCNKEKEKIKGEYLNVGVSQQELINNAVKKARETWEAEEKGKLPSECQEVMGSLAYKIASMVVKAFKLLDLSKILKGGK